MPHPPPLFTSDAEDEEDISNNREDGDIRQGVETGSYVPVAGAYWQVGRRMRMTKRLQRRKVMERQNSSEDFIHGRSSL